MKRAVIIISLLLLTIGFSIFENIYVDRSFKQLNEKFSSLETVIDEHRDDLLALECTEKLNNAMNLWHRKRKNMSMMLPHNSLVELNLKFTRLEATILCNDYEMSKIELYDLLRAMPEYNNRYHPKLVNVI